MNAGTIKRVYFDVDLRCGFEGLRSFLIKEGLDPRTWGQGEFVVFLNGSGKSFKLLAGNNYLVYYKHEDGRVPLEMIQYLPSYFGGSEFNFSLAVKRAIMDTMPKVGVINDKKKGKK